MWTKIVCSLYKIWINYVSGEFGFPLENINLKRNSNLITYSIYITASPGYQLILIKLIELVFVGHYVNSILSKKKILGLFKILLLHYMYKSIFY